MVKNLYWIGKEYTHCPLNLAEMFLAVEICVLNDFWTNKCFIFLDILSTLQSWERLIATGKIQSDKFFGKTSCPFCWWNQNISVQVRTMAADALAPCVTSSSAAMILTMLDKWDLVFYQEIFQLTVSFYCREMIWEMKIQIYFCVFSCGKQLYRWLC